jgi:hypothetical protein
MLPHAMQYLTVWLWEVNSAFCVEFSWIAAEIVANHHQIGCILIKGKGFEND